MSDDLGGGDLGLTGAVSMALGGMIGGGIYAVLGVLTAAFTVVGSLEGITSFASLTFIVVFGGMSFLALSQRDHEDVSAIPPAIGLVGTILFLPTILWHLFSAQRGVFYTVAALAVVSVTVELAYFETNLSVPPRTAGRRSVETDSKNSPSFAPLVRRFESLSSRVRRVRPNPVRYRRRSPMVRPLPTARPPTAIRWFRR